MADNGMTAEERLTRAIDDAGLLSDLIAIDDISADGRAARYLSRKLAENVDELRSAFLAFCDEVNEELREAKSRA
ncbi:hypothetical protein [Limoniibacter endophyticus]|uniref:Uncharacterized protein n=1 Tax=Limoniibacter endophyticus TaxID=1565040 RepID=A0A8J3DFK8_9HYPH|nr:hypothetical protein [Limoniibacter endophyticus]GHC66609.1 hypothetical protein GCM10010136_09830 [Limoniibacter endophyticus]